MSAPKPLTEPYSECEDGTIWRSKHGGNDPDVWAVKCGVCDGFGELALVCDQCSTFRRPVFATEMVDGLPYCAACAVIARDEFAESLERFLGRTLIALGQVLPSQEGEQAEEQQRPVPGERHPAAGIQQRRQAHQQHHDARPVVVVLAPGDVLGVARRQQALAGGEGLRPFGGALLLGLPFGVQLVLQRRNGQVLVARAGQSRRGRGEALLHLMPGHPVVQQVLRRRHAGQRPRDGQHGNTERDFAFDESLDPEQAQRPRE